MAPKEIARFWKQREGAMNVLAAGDRLHNAGIRDGDEVTIDRSVTPQNGDIVLVWIDGNFRLGNLSVSDGQFAIRCGSEERRIVCRDDKEFFIEGVCRIG